MLELKRLEQVVRRIVDGQTPAAIEDLVVLHVRTELMEANEYLQDNMSDLSWEETTVLIKKIEKLSSIANVLAQIVNSRTSLSSLNTQKDIFFAMKHTKELLMEVLTSVIEDKLPEEQAQEITEIQLIPYSILEIFFKDRLDKDVVLSSQFRDLLGSTSIK